MLLLSRGGVGGGNATEGEDGSITGIDCPPGLHGIFCEVVCLTNSDACLDILIMTSCAQNCKYGLIGIMFLQSCSCKLKWILMRVLCSLEWSR
jgi:hypothetical protein